MIRNRPPVVSKIRRTRLEAYTEGWSAISKRVMARDGRKCKKCGSVVGLQVHHIIPISRGGRTIDLNLITLCRVCHAKEPFHKHLRHR